MADKLILSWNECRDRLEDMFEHIERDFFTAFEESGGQRIRVFGIPRGGIPVAMMLVISHPKWFVLADDAEQADIFVDDIIDSGKTREMVKSLYPNKSFYALITKNQTTGWVVFPWEGKGIEVGPEENVRRILQFLEGHAEREGLLETPARVVASWAKLYGGYQESPENILKCFHDDSSDEMVILRDIEFYSTCEHHMLPFFGKAHIAYIPEKAVVGISKLARLLECFSRRLQIQERLCQQVTSSLMEHLHPKGAACVLEAQHFCMTSRGVEKQDSIMVTSSLQGVFRDNHAARSEFFRLIGK